MPDKTTASFREVIGKYLHIADKDYKGHVNDNVLNIFNDLPEEDKKLFLRGVVYIHSIVIGGIETLPKREQKDKVFRKMVEESNTHEVDEEEEDEVIRYFKLKHKENMKNWLTKLVAITMIALFSFVLITSFLSKGGISDPFVESWFNVGKIVNKLFGF